MDNMENSKTKIMDVLKQKFLAPEEFGFLSEMVQKLESEEVLSNFLNFCQLMDTEGLKKNIAVFKEIKQAHDADDRAAYDIAVKKYIALFKTELYPKLDFAYFRQVISKKH